MLGKQIRSLGHKIHDQLKTRHGRHVTNANRWVKVAASTVWTIAVLLIFASVVNQNRRAVTDFLDTTPIRLWLVAFLLLSVAKILLGLASVVSMRVSGINIENHDFYRIYSTTQLAKYIPGGIWHFFGKASMLRRLGASRSSIAVAITIDQFWIALGLGFTILITAPFSSLGAVAELASGTIGNSPWLMGAILVLLILGLLGAVKFSNLSFSTVFTNWTVHFFTTTAFVLSGLALFFLSGLSLSFQHIAFAVLLNAVGQLIGFLFPLAPAGLGVKDAIVVAGLSSLVGVGAALGSVAAHRLMVFGVELFLFLVFRFVTKNGS